MLLKNLINNSPKNQQKLKIKGLVKIENFKKNPNKINYIYVLTPKGFTEKTKLTINFMKAKMIGKVL